LKNNQVIESRFLEPACGDGNFLIEVLKRKLDIVKRKYRKSQYDFELLMSLNIFNNALMNDAVYKFKRYEDSSLEYAGINRHEGENVGGFDTVLSDEEFKDHM
jgi:23S rRNA G2445 N2-methylase RlmL